MNHEVIPCEGGLDARNPDAAAFGGIEYWAFNTDADDNIALARIRGIPRPNTPNTCLLYTSPSPRDS